MAHAKFCVDNLSDPEETAKALTRLRRTVRLGKRAERVLKILQDGGHFDGKVPVFRSRGELCEVHTFPEYVPVSRSDIPGWDKMAVECGPSELCSRGGSKFSVFPVFLKGKALVEERDENCNITGRIVIKIQKMPIFSARLGECHLKSNGTVTFSPKKSVGFTFRMRRNLDSSDRARQDLKTFAETVAVSAVQFGRIGYEARTSTPQKLLDLRKAVPDWLIEDGIVQRMLSDMLDVVEVKKVTDS